MLSKIVMVSIVTVAIMRSKCVAAKVISDHIVATMYSNNNLGSHCCKQDGGSIGVFKSGGQGPWGEAAVAASSGGVQPPEVTQALVGQASWWPARVFLTVMPEAQQGQIYAFFEPVGTFEKGPRS
jgi:hypothetical protein